VAGAGEFEKARGDGADQNDHKQLGLGAVVEEKNRSAQGRDSGHQNADPAGPVRTKVSASMRSLSNTVHKLPQLPAR